MCLSTMVLWTWSVKHFDFTLVVPVLRWWSWHTCRRPSSTSRLSAPAKKLPIKTSLCVQPGIHLNPHWRMCLAHPSLSERVLTIRLSRVLRGHPTLRQPLYSPVNEEPQHAIADFTEWIGRLQPSVCSVNQRKGRFPISQWASSILMFHRLASAWRQTERQRRIPELQPMRCSPDNPTSRPPLPSSLLIFEGGFEQNTASPNLANYTMIFSTSQALVCRRAIRLR